ncbi:hypothetical protein AN1V17_29320 [Vallitalea sediminicola]|uniref:YtxH domain-containing protein n=1 Tax=Vallitalea guaymasensis TaxID=1185412 RepID=A0A8J8MAE1_9FIRM|nr:hypothetical protein [Vallitalea guaymasensis]QUH29292.1 hypothetical protein HYG85_10280 [Vallitalea guaymasensis]
MKFATGLIVGSVIGASSLALVNMDKRDMRKMQRKGKKMMHKAERLMDDLKEMM